MEAQVHPLLASIPRFIQLRMPLPPLKLMGQSQRGVPQVLPHTLIDPSALRAAKALPVPMDQSRRGVVRVMEAQTHPLIMAIPRFIQLRLPLPPAKAYSVE
jgi:hypothetical protein